MMMLGTALGENFVLLEGKVNEKVRYPKVLNLE